MENKFDLWCIVGLFGHQKIAGRCTEQNIAGANMLRVDVPETVKQPAFTRLFGSSAIYDINPVDEQTARFFAEKLAVKPIEAWDIGELIKKHTALQLENVIGDQMEKDDKEDSQWNDDDEDE